MKDKLSKAFHFSGDMSGAHPMIVIAAASSDWKFRYPGRLQILGRGNDDARFIYKYITRRCGANCGRDEEMHFLEN